MNETQTENHVKSISCKAESNRGRKVGLPEKHQRANEGPGGRGCTMTPAPAPSIRRLANQSI
jgi:hypothetical protein